LNAGGSIAPPEQLQWITEIGPVVGDGPAVGEVHRHAMAPARPPSALPVVRRQRRDVAHEDRIQLADVDAQLQRWSADECTLTASELTLEQILDPFPLLVGTIAVCSSGRSIE
jgi:hypothetical protein